MEKLKINTTAIIVQNETKKHFITGSTLFVELLFIFLRVIPFNSLCCKIHH